jgi:hypothetical protein
VKSYDESNIYFHADGVLLEWVGVGSCLGSREAFIWMH